jgi:sulfur carrier protein
MVVHVNGERRDVPGETTVADLIRLVGLVDAACAAEVNKALVPKKRHVETVLRDGDRVELVSLVGGG